MSVVRARQLQVGDLLWVDDDLEEILDLVVGDGVVRVRTMNLSLVTRPSYLFAENDEVHVDQ